MAFLGACFGNKKCQTNKHEVKLAKINAKTEKTRVRVDGRTERTELRSASRTTAYANGIDPNQSKFEAVGNSIQSIGGAVSSYFGGGAIGGLGNLLGGSSDRTAYAQQPQTQNSNMMLYLLLAGIAFLFLKK